MSCDRLRVADLPHSVAQVWREVLRDPQAWADDCFTELEYDSGKRIMVRSPIHFEEAGIAAVHKRAAPRTAYR